MTSILDARFKTSSVETELYNYNFNFHLLNSLNLGFLLDLALNECFLKMFLSKIRLYNKICVL